MVEVIKLKRAKQVCRKTGCNELLDAPGYCAKHAHLERARFSGLKKAAGSEAFYGSSRWKWTRDSFRRANPLCAACLREGAIIKGNLVDHVVERPELIAMGKDPCDWDYLETLCTSHHQKKLRRRKV